MNILMVTPDASMIDRRILLEARSLIAAGHSVTLLAGFECAEEQSYVEYGINIHRYKFAWIDERTQPFLSKAAKLNWVKNLASKVYNFYYGTISLSMSSFEHFIYKKILQFDADVIQAIDLPVLKSCCFAAKEKKVPLFFDAHEIYYAQDIFTKEQKKRLFRTEKKFIKQVDEVFTVNEFIADIMASRYNMRKPHVLLNATDLPRKNPETDLLRQEAGLSPSDKVVLYQGWISPERNIDTLVKSARLFEADTHLVLVGYGAFVQELESICKELHIEDRVHFLGEKPNSELELYTQKADIGVIPYAPIDENHLYCSPNKLFEFIACGLPFICNELPFFSSIQKQYGALTFCDMSNEEAISSTINSILQQPEKLQLLRTQCQEAAKTLNWEVEGEKIVNVYEKHKQRITLN